MATLRRPGRNETDNSLAHERGKTDDELLKRTGAYEETANSVVARARQHADEVVVLARGKADERLKRSGASGDQWAALRKERHADGAALGRERATADENLASERDEGRRALTTLLASEREHTDERLGTERELADAAIASRDDFLAMASHDLRNMLGGIALSAACLTNVRCDDEVHDEVVRHAQRIQRHIVRMTRLVGDLVDLVSIESGRLAVEPSRHDAVELLQETLDVFQPLAAAKRISIGTDVKGGTVLARYDHERIVQVLANLVGNALKFTPEGGRIHILVEPLESDVRFTVSDTGPGIAPEKLGAIFERFWQVPNKGAQAGLGLGLYISKCIVEAHGGKIWAESQVGEGITFRFTLPAPDASSGEGAERRARACRPRPA